MSDRLGRLGEFYKQSNAMLSAFLSEAISGAGTNAGAAMRANDLHRHLSKYQADAAEALTREAAGSSSPAESDAAVDRFMMECMVLAPAAQDSALGNGMPIDACPEVPGSTGQRAGAAGPTDEELSNFKATIVKFSEVDDRERALRAEASLKRAEKAKLSAVIAAFMQKYDLDDIATGQGTLRCVRRKTKTPLSRSAMADRIRSFFGDDLSSAEALRGNLFEAGEERESVSIMRIRPKPPRV